MLIDRSWSRTRLTACSMALLLTAAGWDEPPKADKPNNDASHPAVSKPEAVFDPGAEGGMAAALEARLSRIQEIKPLPLVPIPDDPPPHEGAMFDLPYIVEPPDLLRVEVLEALPGRPIEGERLVRPDGTITLGFYGDIYVRGLTVAQIKEKVILHLRRYIKDEVLGIIVPDLSTDFDPLLPPPPPPGARPDDEFPLDEPKTPSPKPSGATTKPTSAPRPITSGNDPRVRSRRGTSAQPHRIRKISDEGQPIPIEPSTVRVSNPKGVKITIEVQGDNQDAGPDFPPVPIGFALPGGRYRLVDPTENDRVYIDVAAYNNQVYFVQGDVTSPGRLPCTGNETVLDALNYAGGFSATADVTDVHLVRPARAGKPTRIYPIDYKAIVDQGDPGANLQIFPGDRLVVGRHPTVRTTIELDRMAAGKNTVFSNILTYAFVMRSLANMNQPFSSDPDSFRFKIAGHTISIQPDRPQFDSAQSAAIMKAWAEFWSKSLRIGVPMDDDRAVTEQILKQLAPENPLGLKPEKPEAAAPGK